VFKQVQATVTTAIHEQEVHACMYQGVQVQHTFVLACEGGVARLVLGVRDHVDVLEVMAGKDVLRPDCGV
jgi:hypothetical protein